MKRVLVLLLAVVMVISFTACTPAAEPSPTTEPEAAAPTAPAQPDVPVFSGALAITEVMPDNRNLVLGHDLDWVELYNPEDVSGQLQGYFLTDDPGLPEKFPLAEYTIPAGGYLVVALAAESLQLSEQGQTLYLMCQGQTVSELTFPTAGEGASFDPEGRCEYPTPGYANTLEGYQAYLENTSLPELAISEVLPGNNAVVVEGLYYDYIEVENRSASPVALQDYYLTDSWGGRNRYYFPAVTLQPGEFYLVLCSGDGELGANHADFGVGAGETVYLAREGVFIDALSLPEDLKLNESYGRSGNLPVYLQEATPGTANTEGFLTGVEAPGVSIPSGIYDTAVTVTLTGPGTIHYTLDGSRPTAASPVYTDPVVIDGVTTIRAVSVSADRVSAVANYTYVIGKTHDLPVLVISMPTESRFSLMYNIQSSQEYEAVMTLFEDGELKFSVPFGMRLHGNDSRKGAKKNFQLRFRGEYGAGKLEYRLFPDRDIDEYDSLLLKGGSEDYINAMVRDELATSIANGNSALYTQAMKSVVLYLGGEYWGVHYLRERFSDAYVASHLGVSEESVDLLFSSGGYVQTGRAGDFNAIKTYIRNHDMSKPESYAYLAQEIDVNSLIDWYVFRTYLDDRDLANIRRFRSTEGDGKWRWMFFDMDWGFYNQGSYPVSDIINDPNGEPLLIRALLASDAGQDAFLRRYAYQMQTVLNEEYINACLDRILTDIASEMPRDRERWNMSYASWELHIRLIRDFARDDTRVDLILNDLKTYFQLSDQQMREYFGDLYQ